MTILQNWKIVLCSYHSSCVYAGQIDLRVGGRSSVLVCLSLKYWGISQTFKKKKKMDKEIINLSLLHHCLCHLHPLVSANACGKKDKRHTYNK